MENNAEEAIENLLKKKSLKFIDTVIIGISDGNQKNFLFNINERIERLSEAGIDLGDDFHDTMDLVNRIKRFSENKENGKKSN